MLQNLIAISKLKKYSKKSIIFLAGDKANYLYFLKSGIVKLYKTDTNGREIEINRITEGQIFAEVFAFSGSAYPITAQTVTESEVLKINTKAIYEKTKEDNELALYIIKVLASRCLKLHQTIDNLHLEELPVRVIRYFYQKIDPLKVIDNKIIILLDIKKKGPG